MEKHSVENFNIFLLGDSGVGKTTFIFRILPDYSSSSCGRIFEWYRKTVKITINQHSKIYHLQLWDTSGEESLLKFHLLMMKIQKAKGILLFYDITRKSTFQNLHNFFKEIKQFQPDERIPIFLIGAKADQFMNSEIPYGDEDVLAKEYKCLHFLSFPFNTENLFRCIVKEILCPSKTDYYYYQPYLSEEELKEKGAIISPAEDVLFLYKKKTQKSKKCIY